MHHVQDDDEELEEYALYTLNVANLDKVNSWRVAPLIDGVRVPMEIDTGSAVSIVPRRFWEKELKEKPLQKCATIVKTVTGERVSILGQTNVRVSHKGEEVELPILVMKGEGPTLLGGN